MTPVVQKRLCAAPYRPKRKSRNPWPLLRKRKSNEKPQQQKGEDEDEDEGEDLSVADPLSVADRLVAVHLRVVVL